MESFKNKKLMKIINDGAIISAKIEVNSLEHELDEANKKLKSLLRLKKSLKNRLPIPDEYRNEFNIVDKKLISHLDNVTFDIVHRYDGSDGYDATKYRKFRFDKNKGIYNIPVVIKGKVARLATKDFINFEEINKTKSNVFDDFYYLDYDKILINNILLNNTQYGLNVYKVEFEGQ